MKRAQKNEPRVRINLILRGEPAEWLISWRERGLISSYTDAVIQALRALHEKIVEQDLKALQVRNLNRINEDTW
ncbi:hypothetical protein DRN63_03360 [Nanoarchaeota archaeon]|nr:MAG: hypothetical protein DRN63_03360 [Nanoarchaeota archaeon]